MEYKVYQVTLTDADVNLVNAEGHHAVPKHLRNLNLSMGFGKTDDEKRALFAEAWSEGDYGAPVATVWKSETAWESSPGSNVMVA